MVCLSANGQGGFVSPAPATELLVGTIDGIVVLTREGLGAPWSTADHFLQGMHVGALAQTARRGAWYAATYGHGVLVKQVSEGWEPRWTRDGPADVWTVLTCDSEDEVVYAGTGPPGLYRSQGGAAAWEDLSGFSTLPGSESWTFPPPPHVAHVKAIALPNNDATTIYVGIEQGGLMKSIDGGTTWRELDGYTRAEDKQYKDIHRIAISSADPKKIYLATGDGLNVSHDAGETWAFVQSFADTGMVYPDAMALSPTDDDDIFVGAASIGAGPAWRDKSSGVYFTFFRSTDGGATWQSLHSRLPIPLAVNVEAITVHDWSGGTSVFAATATGLIFGSDDNGETWQHLATLNPVSPIGHYRHFL